MEPGLILKATGILALVLFVACSTTGCSILVAEPSVAHVEIEGLNHHFGNFSIDLDPKINQQMDIHLTNHYALRLDFKWIWERSFNTSLTNYNEDGVPMVPWITCKYRF
jgi:hypothetical protein